MRLQWSLALAFGAGVAVLGLLVIEDLLLGPYLPYVNPDVYLWAGGVVAGAAGLVAATDRLRRTGAKRAGLGVALGVAGFVLALAVVQFYAASTDVHGYRPSIRAEVALDGAWDPDVAAQALEAQGFKTTRPTGHVTGDQRLDDGTRAHAFIRAARGGEQAVDLTVFYRPDQEYETAQAARGWQADHRSQVEGHFEAFLASFLQETGWVQAGNVTFETSLSVG